MSIPKVEILETSKTDVGEGPHWDAARETLYSVDIRGHEIRSYNPYTMRSTKVNIGSDSAGHGPSFVVPIAGSEDEFVIAQGRTLKKLHWDSNSETEFSLSEIYETREPNNPDGFFNDGKCDSRGRLWTGTMPIWKMDPLTEDLGKGVIHKLDKNGTVTKEWFGIDVSNGLTWSPDNTKFYFVDSYAGTIDAFDFDVGAGKISNQRSVYDYKNEKKGGFPDGMTTDVNGNLWVASVFLGQVIQLDPNVGKVISRIQLPTCGITSVAFGGRHLDELYVTSLRSFFTPEQLAAEPEAGSLFRITNLGTRGVSAGTSYFAT